MKNIIYSLLLLFLLSACTEKTDSLLFKNSSELIFDKQNKTLQIRSKNDSLIAELKPIRIELHGKLKDTTIYSFYESINKTDSGFLAKAKISIDNAQIHISDIWTQKNNSPILSRTLKIEGSSEKAFMSAIEFEFVGKKRSEIDYFVPGMIYGSTKNLTESAIGGALVYKQGNGNLWIREDRMPAPILAFRFNDENSFSILDAKPNGKTTLKDAHDVLAETIIDENLQFGSLFAEHKNDTLKTGFAFPSSEGEYTYQGNTYPGGQLHKWRKRYHPLKNGLVQNYTLSFNSDSYEDFQKFYFTEWQMAFVELKPEVNQQNIELVRKTMLSILPNLAVRKSNKVGLSNWYDATDATDKLIDNKAVFGFTGKNIEIAYYLLYNATIHADENSEIYKKLAYEIISSFTNLKVNPPVGEGYYFETGKPALAIPHHNHIYLRSYGDAMKILAKAYLFEKENGKENGKDIKEWLDWMTNFAEWILNEQYKDGGFPRAWKPITGEISEKSPASSYNIIPFLCEMYKITDNKKWLNAAIKTGDFSWESGQITGRFVGGTIDNPDVLDKEAGTLSIEAYLSLYETTEDNKWLQRAEIAAQFAETWMYIWNIPMVENDPNKEWANNVNTVGLQLISTGHSLVDNYMAFDVDEYAKLYKYTGKKHYIDVAKILLHNTKGMLALENRKYQYRAVGWIQEHWSLAPPRGKALHPGWLPWVTTSNLNGICETEMFDKEIYNNLCNTH